MSLPAVQISPVSHVILKEIVAIERKQGARANNGLVVEHLIQREAQRLDINLMKIVEKNIKQNKKNR